ATVAISTLLKDDTLPVQSVAGHKQKHVIARVNLAGIDKTLQDDNVVAADHVGTLCERSEIDSAEIKFEKARKYLPGLSVCILRHNPFYIGDLQSGFGTCLRGSCMAVTEKAANRFLIGSKRHGAVRNVVAADDFEGAGIQRYHACRRPIGNQIV